MTKKNFLTTLPANLIALSVVVIACSGGGTATSSSGGLPSTTKTFNVSAPNAPNSYTINGSDNPTLTLAAGQTYTFELSVSGHPFYIMSSQGTNTANAYNTGVVGNGNQTGTVVFTVPTNAPTTLYYDCSIHAGMTGVINITGSGGGGSTPTPTGTPTPTATPSANFVVTTPNAPSSYSMNGTSNASITVQRGQTYTFSISASGHPFYIMSVQGTNTANAYNNGVTGNGTQNGTLTWTVPMGAPNTLYYDCSIHSGMTGTITVTN